MPVWAEVGRGMAGYPLPTCTSMCALRRCAGTFPLSRFLLMSRSVRAGRLTWRPGWARLPRSLASATMAGRLGLAWPGGAGHKAPGLNDERGDVLGGLVCDLGEHGGVGVGCEDDAGVAEHVLDDLQVRPAGSGAPPGTRTPNPRIKRGRTGTSEQTWSKHRCELV